MDRGVLARKMANKSAPQTRSSKTQVREWLKAEGFPFEMKVVHALHEHEFHSTQGEYFVDPDTEKAREIDVVTEIVRRSTTGKFEIAFLFAIECKFTRKSPWVFFTAAETYPRKIGFDRTRSKEPGTILLSNLDVIETLPKFGFFTGPKLTAYSVTTALPVKNQDVAYQACAKVLSATECVLHVTGGLLSHPTTLRLKFPLIVSDGPLYRAFLNTRARLCVETARHIRLPWKSDDLRNTRTIDVVTFEHLPMFLRSLVDELDHLVAACEHNSELYSNPSLALENVMSIFSRPEAV